MSARSPLQPLDPTANRPAVVPSSGYSIAIRREGGRVHITLTSAAEYAAIELYDTLVKAAEAGSIRLDLVPK